jgi:hypothetical protein
MPASPPPSKPAATPPTPQGVKSAERILTPAAPQPAPQVTPPARQSFADELDAGFGSTPPAAKAPEAPKPADTPKATPDAPKAASETPVAQAGTEDEYLIDPAKPAEAAAAKAGEGVKEAVREPVKKTETAPELRAELARRKTQLAALEKQLAESKAKPVDDTERKTYTEQIAGLNKKLEDAMGSLKFADYESSEEYTTKYEAPFVEAWNDGVQQVTGLSVVTDEGTRKGTPEDFQAIMRESDNERAATMATEMFGSNAFYVLASRRELVKLNNARVKAVGEFKSGLSERLKTEAEKAEKTKTEFESQRIQRITTFKKLNDEAATKYPDLFAPLEGDDEGNKILEKGFKDADLAFQGANGLSSDQVVRLHSAVRNRAAGFGRLTYRLKQRDSRIAELEKELAEIRGSAPGDGAVGKSDQKPKVLSAFDEIEAAAGRG